MLKTVHLFLILTLVTSRLAFADCVRDTFPLTFGEQPGIWFGLPAGMGEFVLKCAEVSRICPTSSQDGFGLAAIANVGGPVKQRILITRVQVVGRDANLINLKLRIQRAYNVYKNVRVPIRLERTASSFTGVPEELFVYAQCPLPEMSDLDAAIKISYRRGWDNSKTYTKILRIQQPQQ